MTQVDFYILNNASLPSLELYACKLTEKAFKKGHKIHILTADQEQSERIDKLLWTFDEQSFVPHVFSQNALANETSIHIGHEADKVTIDDVLINLQTELPKDFAKFARIAELVSADTQAKQSARNRYREYQRQQCQVATHEVNR